VIRAGCADRDGGGQHKHRMGLRDGGPDTRSGLAVSLAGADDICLLPGRRQAVILQAGNEDGMAPTGRSKCSNQFSELEPRYGIEL
jgi:hypothetical protein